VATFRYNKPRIDTLKVRRDVNVWLKGRAGLDRFEAYAYVFPKKVSQYDLDDKVFPGVVVAASRKKGGNKNS